MGRLALALLLLIAGARGAHAGLVHMPDLLPASQNSPLLVAPEAAKLEPFTGAVAYAYPFAVPPGTGDATPELALQYSSLTRATEYGWGWSLGLGRIERSTRHGPPSYTDADRFELDGELLVPDPRDGSRRYHRERTRFERIVFVADAAGGWWSVTRPDGTELRYGSRHLDGATSRLRNPYEASADGDPATVDVFRWRLDAVIDPRGNAYRIDYEASCTDGDGDCTCEDGESCPDAPPVESHLYPRRIAYSFRETGSATALQASRRVELVWAPRAYPGEDEDRPTSYRGGFQDRISRRLVGITTRVDGAQAARWVLEYFPKTTTERPDLPPFSQLRSIRRHGRDARPFPAPTSFTYTAPELLPDLADLPNALPPGGATFCDDALRDATSISIEELPFSSVALVDLDGDGLLDRLGNEPACSSVRSWSVMFGRAPDPDDPVRFEPKRPWLWYDADGGASTLVPDDTLPYPGFAADEGDSALECGHWSEVQIVDLDGDGRADHVDLVHAPVAPGGPEDLDAPVLHWRVRPGRGDGFGAPVLWSPPEHAVPPHPGSTGPREWPMYGRTLGFRESCGETGFETHSLSRLLDVNGDGRPDHLARTDPGTWSIALNAGCDASGCGFHPPTTVAATTVAGGSDALSTLHRLLGETGRDQTDVDGDGLPDRVLSATEGLGGTGCLVVRPAILQTGVHEHRETTCGMDAAQSLYGPFASLRDVNADGWLDRLDRVDFLDAQVVYLGLGDGRFSRQPIRARAHRGGEYAGGVDLDSDGLPEEVSASGEHGYWSVLSHGSPPGLLASITGELGGVTRLEYTSTARFAQRQARAASPEQREQVLEDPAIAPARRHWWVVSRIEVSDGRVGTTPQTRVLSYAEPRSDRARREILGLRMAELRTAGVTTRSLFHQDRARRGLLQLEETLTPGESGDLVHRGRALEWSVYRPVTEDSPASAPLPIPDASFAAATRERSWLADPHAPGAPRQMKLVSREYGWADASKERYTRLGNLLWEQDHGPDADDAQAGDDGLRTEYLYAPDLDGWRIDYPAQIAERAADGTLLGRTRFRYDGAASHLQPPTRGLLTARLQLADAATGEELVEILAYDTPQVGPDTVGNVTRHWDPDAVASGRTAASTTLVWDDDAFGSRVVASRDALGHETRYEIDPLDGQLRRRLDPNGLLECWQRDGFGRLIARSRGSAPRTALDAVCDEVTATFEFRTYAPAGDPPVAVDAQRVREVLWARGVSAPAPPCDAQEPGCVEQLRYFDGLSREHFSAREALKRLEPGDAGRFVQERREWGPRGELRCSWLPARGGEAPPGRTPDEPPCDDPVHGDLADRRVLEYDALERVVSESHAGATLRSVRHAVRDQDPGTPGLERVEEVRIHAGGDPGSPDRYRELGRDRDAALVSVCEDPHGDGRCDPATRLRIERDARKQVLRVDGPDLPLDGGGTHANLISLLHDAAGRRVGLVRAGDATRPLLGPTWRWEYDAAGRVRRSIPPRGAAAAVVQHRDALGRVIYVDRPPLQPGAGAPGTRAPGDVQLVYDEPGDLAAGLGANLGRLTGERSDALTRRHDASLDGRRTRSVSTFHRPAGDVALALETELDGLGRVTRRVQPDGTVLRFDFEGDAPLAVALERPGAEPELLIDRIRAHPSGRLERLRHVAAGVTVERGYPDAADQRLTWIRATGPGGPLQHLRIERDRAGNPRCITDARLAPDICEQELRYDGLHRPLRAVDRRDPRGPIELAYDAAGRLVRRGDDALRHGRGAAPPDAVTTVLVGAHAVEAGAPGVDDPCPSHPGAAGGADASGDGIPDACQCGDASGDGRIDVLDLLALGRCILDPASCSDPLCDANGDGACNVADVLAVNAAIFSERYFELTCARRPEGLPLGSAIERYAWDADGRLREREVAGERLELDWDDEGRLIGLRGARAASYAHDAEGERVRVNVAGADTLLPDPDLEHEPAAGVWRAHLRVLGERVLTLERTGEADSRRLLLGDHVGSQRLVLDGSGAPLQRAVVSPYGELRALLDARGAPVATLASPFVFAGLRHDAHAGLHHTRSREYDPRIASFLSPDPALIGPAGEAWERLDAGAISIDAYAWAHRRPGTLVDPDGRHPVALAIRIGAPLLCRSACAGLLGGIGGALLGPSLVAHRDDADPGGEGEAAPDDTSEPPVIRVDPETGVFEGVPEPPDPAGLQAHEGQAAPPPPDVDVETPAPRTLGARIVEALRDLLALVDKL